ncbi:hypothetical protein Tco_1225473 [Tanacetum coccineum]
MEIANGALISIREKFEECNIEIDNKSFPMTLLPIGIKGFDVVEFRVDLVPEAAPIARKPYHLAPTEMKEMMSQLKDLLYKGFIRPNYHSCKANVVADALSQKDPKTAYRVKSMRIEVVPGLFEQIWAAQIEALKDENLKSEQMLKRHLLLDDDKRRLKTFEVCL